MMLPLEEGFDVGEHFRYTKNEKENPCSLLADDAKKECKQVT